MTDGCVILTFPRYSSVSHKVTSEIVNAIAEKMMGIVCMVFQSGSIEQF